LALHRAGFTVRATSPRRRCALTAPFHLCLCAAHVWPRHRPSALCGTFPRVSPGGRYPPPSPCGVRTFLEGMHLRDCLAREEKGTCSQESCEPHVLQRADSSSPLQTGQSARPSRRKASQAPRTTSSSVTSDGSNNLRERPSSSGRLTATAVSVATALTRPSGRRRRRCQGSERRGCEVASCSCSRAGGECGPSP
jgi:hypothetical protein